MFVGKGEPLMMNPTVISNKKRRNKEVNTVARIRRLGIMLNSEKKSTRKGQMSGGKVW